MSIAILKKATAKLPYPFLFLLFLHSIVWSQKLQPYGLQGKTVTALAYYGGALFAGTDGDGVFLRQAADSSWQDFGLKDVHIRSIYPHEIGPNGWGITVGTEPDKMPSDSVLTYCWSIYEPTWVVSDSNLDRSQISIIHAFDGFPDPRI